MEKRKKINGAVFHTTKMRQGTYSIGLTAVVIAIVVVLNLILGQLPEKYRNLDVSSTKIYEITDTSREFLEKLDQEVKLTVLAVKEETDERIQTFLSKYASLSKQISVEWIDPVLHPSALSQYETSENTIIVSSERTGKTTTVAFGDIIVSDMSSYYYTGSASESEFDGEGQLTSAVYYVTSDVQKKIYRTTGHGESTLSASMTDLLDKNNLVLSELNLLMETEVPKDCDLLLMYAPANDLAEEEKETILSYLAGGGKMLLLFGEKAGTELPNLAAVTEEYGIETVEGYIADPTRCYQGNAYYIFPELQISGDMAKGISSEMVLLINTRGLSLTNAARDTISTESFMTTGSSGYAVTETTETPGTYTLGAVATEPVSGKDETEEEGAEEHGENKTEESESSGNGTKEDETAGNEMNEARLTVISSASMIDAQITDTFPTLENTTLFLNAVMANFEGVENLSIEPKSLAVQYNAVQYVGFQSLLVVFGIPILILAGGFFVWLKRRKA